MPSSDQPAAPIIALVKDLIFSSRIGATARAESAAVQMVRDPAQLASLNGALLILDLNLAGAIEAASAWLAAGGSDAPQRHAVGFVSHVDAATIDAAKAAGIPQVLPRSRFVQVLPELLRSHK